jgi:hypothetical protein
MEEALASAYRAFKVPEGDKWLYRALMEGSDREMRRHTEGRNVWFARFASIRDELRGVIEQVSQRLPGRPLTGPELDSLAEDLSLERQKARPKVEPFDPVTLLSARHFG